jgi:hypothetical protein
MARFDQGSGILDITLQALVRTSDEGASVPWFLWCALLASTSLMAGIYWDISWHRSIGRDTFWTPAHGVIYLSAFLAAICCGHLVYAATFDATKDAASMSVDVLGLRGPIGAFMCGWGGFAMLTAAPFDVWWHATYGLDIKLLSPPHLVLEVGMLAVELGILTLLVSYRNRALETRNKLDWMVLWVAGMVLVDVLCTLVAEPTLKIFMHSAQFYRVASLVVPAILVGIAKTSHKRWAATSAAAVYTIFLMCMIWILPLFPAEPKLGPVYQLVKHFIPMEFPWLLILPAFAIDLLLVRAEKWHAMLQATVTALVFLMIFAPVQWIFADFLMSPAARNWFFGAAYLPYGTAPTSFYARNEFYPLEHSSLAFWVGMFFAWVFAIISARFGLAWGHWMTRIQR